MAILYYYYYYYYYYSTITWKLSGTCRCLFVHDHSLPLFGLTVHVGRSRVTGTFPAKHLLEIGPS